MRKGQQNTSDAGKHRSQQCIQTVSKPSIIQQPRVHHQFRRRQILIQACGGSSEQAPLYQVGVKGVGNPSGRGASRCQSCFRVDPTTPARM